jgi:type IV secretory pathway VirJ component
VALRSLALCVLLSAAGSVHAADFDGGMVPTDRIVLPAGPASGVVAVVSAPEGWAGDEEALADALRRSGLAVIGIDLADLLEAIASREEDCVYLVADIERLSHQIQRATDASDYHAPIVAGVGIAGGLALDLVAQSPAATIGGIVVTDPAVAVHLAKPLCTAATHTDGPGGSTYALPTGPAVEPVSIGLSADAPAPVRDRVAAFAASATNVTVVEGAAPSVAGLEERIRDMARAGAGGAAGLPVVELPATPSHDTLAIVLSGDGGWRDLDKTIGGILQSEGVPTLGLDSLRYFWSKRTPAGTAHDLGALIRDYTARWNVANVALVGYSFGADVLPDTILALDPDVRARLRQVSLLGLSPQADWEITVSGWLGSASGDATATGPALARLPPALIQCIYGTAETDSPCPGLAGSGAEVIATKGGHHFDGNYDALAAAILAGLDHRRADPPAPHAGAREIR